MVQKRQLAEEEYDVSPKHLKLEHSYKDEDCFFKPVIGIDYGFVSGKFTDLPVCTTEDVDYTLPGRLSTSSWASSTTSEEDLKADAYSYLLERSPLKEVPIGPEYQADIPEWREYDGNEIKLMGSCIIPMPEDPIIRDNETVGKGRTDCYCKSPGSHICIQQHINEANEILNASIGHKRFTELGFGNLGEVVAEKWSETDERLFHDVIYSNPVSSGKNFWDHLAAEFPSCTNQEIVSYYFNVFMLRRRAEQNRCDLMNIDSDDDDEWQGSDRLEEEDEIHESDSCEGGNGIENRYNGLQPRKLDNSCSYDSISQPSDGDYDFQYDSCTSSDGVGAPCVSEVDSSKSWGNHEFIYEPADSRVWDVGYFSCTRTKTDFLPTGSMIEEVFGVESWNFEVTGDDKS